MFGRFSGGRSEDRRERDAVLVPLDLPPPPAAPDPATDFRDTDEYLSLKVDLHRHLVDRFNLASLEQASSEQIRDDIRPVVREYIRTSNIPLNSTEIDNLVSDTADEMLGLGPLEPLLKDDSIADILINTHRKVYIERRGQLVETNVRFRDEAHLLRIVNEIVSAVGSEFPGVYLITPFLHFDSTCELARFAREM